MMTDKLLTGAAYKALGRLPTEAEADASLDAFAATFLPLAGDEDDEEPGEVEGAPAIWFRNEPPDKPDEFVWTLVEEEGLVDDKGANFSEQWISPGFCSVNQLAFVVTLKPWQEGQAGICIGRWADAVEVEPGVWEYPD